MSATSRAVRATRAARHAGGQRLPLLFAPLPGWDSRSSGLSTVEIMPVATCV